MPTSAGGFSPDGNWVAYPIGEVCRHRHGRRSAGASGSSEIQVVLNWFEELTARGAGR
jgi:hypothetical protein